MLEAAEFIRKSELIRILGRRVLIWAIRPKLPASEEHVGSMFLSRRLSKLLLEIGGGDG